MSTPEQYRDEAMRLLDLNPLDVCERVMARLKGRGWRVEHFDCKVEVFEAIRWYVKVHIKTEVTKKSLEEKWRELQAIFEELELSVDLVVGGIRYDTETTTHRRYDTQGLDGRRVLIGRWYNFHVQFKPAKPLDISVLTEEEA
jgi:hypothetical protein